MKLKMYYARDKKEKNLAQGEEDLRSVMDKQKKTHACIHAYNHNTHTHRLLLYLSVCLSVSLSLSLSLLTASRILLPPPQRSA
jgi:hypothetical protein